MPSSDGHPFFAWLERWMELARYHDRDVPDPEARTEQLIALWNSDIPGGWRRGTDPQILDPEVRYRHGDADQGPRADSEHELEFQLLRPDPSVTETRRLGERLIDGINAVPLAHDSQGHRAGNVEADMLLLTAVGADNRLLLVEAKTGSNNAWYATVENLRQLRLFLASDAARQIMQHRRAEPTSPPTPVTAVVLAPASFYTAPGARRCSPAPTQTMIEQLTNQLHLDIRLTVWNNTARTVTQLNTADWHDSAVTPK